MFSNLVLNEVVAFCYLRGHICCKWFHMYQQVVLTLELVQSKHIHTYMYNKGNTNFVCTCDKIYIDMMVMLFNDLSRCHVM